jgi:hypothetical protein
MVGALIGGALGYAAFFWLVRQGFYGLVIPGVFLGLGAHLLARKGSLLMGLLCGLLALLLGIYTEWRFAPFLADDSLRYFLTHMTALKPMTWIMISVGGALISFWLGSSSLGSRGKQA